MEAVGLSHRGYCRDNNEDSYLMDKERGLFILCDGMGGHLGGEVASDLAVQVVSRELKRREELSEGELEPAAALRKAIEKANEEIWEESHRDINLREMGTTLTTAWIHGNSLLVGHVGDSSLFVFTKEKSMKVTHDHTLAESMRCSGMANEKNEFSAYEHVLTRALGMGETIRPDFFSRELSGFETILLASDGLTDLMEEKEIFQTIQKKISLQKKAQELVDTALARGGYDNITVILVQLYEGGRL